MTIPQETIDALYKAFYDRYNIAADGDIAVALAHAYATVRAQECAGPEVEALCARLDEIWPSGRCSCNGCIVIDMVRTALCSQAAEIARIDNHWTEALEERDRAQDALLEASMALDGPEWCGKLPPEPPPNSGDLHLDVPELCREWRERAEAAEASLAAATTRCAELERDAERLDWLDKQCSEGNGRHLACIAGCLRAAIDAAMKGPDHA